MDRSVVLCCCGLLLAFTTALPNPADWDIYSFHINSTVTSRYATTTITSRVVNRVEESREIEFHVRIPKNAFISRFRMFIDGQAYDGLVKAKEEAKQQYTDAVSRGESAGIVSSVGRTLEEFKTSVTVAALKKVTFELTYEELLMRRLGKYELQIHARPMQPVKDFKVDVYIHESANIDLIDVKGSLATKALANAVTKMQSGQEAWVHFYPTEDLQKSCDNCDDQGLNGDLVVVYDVRREDNLGDIQKSPGYFVHHFAPGGLPRISKNVVFLIDQSGSMHGRKIEQTRLALIQILSELAEDDFFGLITFDGKISHWKRELLQATSDNVESAKNFARKIEDRGATNINDAVLAGARMLNDQPREGSASLIILLTDGDPTSGVTNLEAIQSNVRKAIAGKFPLYCLGFGYDVNFEFLEKMSLQNNGVARRIYEDSDADSQLKGFYEEVATPLLTDVTMLYLGGTNLTQTNFSHFYNGSEIVVAGQITDNETFEPSVEALSIKVPIKFTETSNSRDSSGSDSRIQRVWAFITVKQMLEQELLLSGEDKKELTERILKLSLKYNFVTPLTSMVVTKPPGENADVLHKPKEGENPNAPGTASRTGFIGVPGHIGFGVSAPSGSRRTFSSPPAQGFIHHSIMYSQVDSVLTLAKPVPKLDGNLYYDEPETLMDFEDKTRTLMVLDVAATQMPLPATTTTADPLGHRFVLHAENLSLPLCFDVSGSIDLKLLHHYSGDLFVDGKLDSMKFGGFERIVVHLRTDHYIDIDINGISVKMDHTVTPQTGEVFTTGRATVTSRGKEIDITAGDTRLVVYRHEKDGKKFLWPVVRQKPSGDDIHGILVPKAPHFEQITGSTKLKIGDQEFDTTRSTATDYSLSSSPTVWCLLTSADVALQSSLGELII